jgi:hypothetical protein
MKMLTPLLVFAMACPALAEIDSLPTEENAFLDVIPHVTPARVAELLGEPAQVSPVLDKDSGEEIGIILHYRYINTNSAGEYYKTTELDYVGNKLMVVVFSNKEIEESAAPMAPGPGECVASC